MVKEHCKEKKDKGSGAVIALMAISSAITLLGAAFGVYAVLNNISFSVMSAKIPGVVFAAVVIFLGVRYFIASLRLKEKIRGMKFSWSNFKRQANSETSKSGKAFGAVKKAM
jgi:hypothetical protein